MEIEKIDYYKAFATLDYKIMLLEKEKLQIEKEFVDKFCYLKKNDKVIYNKNKFGIVSNIRFNSKNNFIIKILPTKKNFERINKIVVHEKYVSIETIYRVCIK